LESSLRVTVKATSLQAIIRKTIGQVEDHNAHVYTLSVPIRLLTQNNQKKEDSDLKDLVLDYSLVTRHRSVLIVLDSIIIWKVATSSVAVISLVNRVVIVLNSTMRKGRKVISLVLRAVSVPVHKVVVISHVSKVAAMASVAVISSAHKVVTVLRAVTASVAVISSVHKVDTVLRAVTASVVAISSVHRVIIPMLSIA
jgi:hypothetical protein